MKTIKCDGIDHILLTEKEYKNLRKKRIEFLETLIEIQIPFKDNCCSNWNDQGNWWNHTGIIYKGEQITLGKLNQIKRLLSKEENSVIETSVHFDHKRVKLDEITDLIDFIQKNINFSYDGRKDFKIISHYE